MNGLSLTRVSFRRNTPLGVGASDGVAWFEWSVDWVGTGPVEIGFTDDSLICDGSLLSGIFLLSGDFSDVTCDSFGIDIFGSSCCDAEVSSTKSGFPTCTRSSSLANKSTSCPEKGAFTSTLT